MRIRQANMHRSFVLVCAGNVVANVCDTALAAKIMLSDANLISTTAKVARDVLTTHSRNAASIHLI